MGPFGTALHHTSAFSQSSVPAGYGNPLRPNRQQHHLGHASPNVCPSPGGAASYFATTLSIQKPTAPDLHPASPSRSVATSASVSSSGTGKHIPTLGDLRKGQMIAYQRDKKKAPAIGLVDEACGKKKWKVTTVSGQTINVLETEIAAILPGDGPYSQAQLQAAAAEATATQAGTTFDTVRDAWELSDPDEPASLAQMTKDIFGGKTQSPAEYAATFSLMIQYRKYFKMSSRSPPTFTPRGEAEVAAVDAEEAVQRQVEADAAAFKALVEICRQQARSGMSAADIREELGQSEHTSKLAALEQLALRHTDSTELSPAAKSASHALSISATPDAAAAQLRACGWWRRHDLVQLLRLAPSLQFSPDLQAAAVKVGEGAVADTDGVNRVHMQDMHVMTIDDISTTEIDDGLSAEKQEDGSYKVWVHIADPTRWLGPPGSPLDLEAALRGKTVYLPTGTIPMFPHSVAAGCFSLRASAGSVPAMSISATVAEDGALLDYAIMPTLIEPKDRLTYVQADDIIANLDQESATGAVPQALAALHQIAQRRRAWRTQQGAVEISTPDVSWRVDLREDDEIEDVDIDASHPGQSASGSLVAEMMILANQAVAEYGTEHGLPLPYRSQAAPILPSTEELEALPEGVCRDIALRNCMTKSVTSVVPGAAHASLGLPSYVQFTSPIRRYTDMLAHYQVKAHVRGQSPPFSAEMLTDMVDESAMAVRARQGAERAAETYWSVQYFSRQAAGALYGGQFVTWRRQDLGLGKVIMDLGMEVSVKFARPLVIGERVELRLESCNAEALELSFMDATPAELASEAETEAEADAEADVSPSSSAEELQNSLQEQSPGVDSSHSATLALETSAFMATLPPASNQQTISSQP